MSNTNDGNTNDENTNVESRDSKLFTGKDHHMALSVILSSIFTAQGIGDKVTQEGNKPRLFKYMSKDEFVLQWVGIITNLADDFATLFEIDNKNFSREKFFETLMNGLSATVSTKMHKAIKTAHAEIQSHWRNEENCSPLARQTELLGRLNAVIIAMEDRPQPDSDESGSSDVDINNAPPTNSSH